MPNSNSGSGAGIAILVTTVGGVMVYSALKGISIVDVLSGKEGDTLDPHGAPVVNPYDSGVGVSVGVPVAGTGEQKFIGGLGTYPLAKHGSIIGTPHAGTHTLGNWQSDNAVDISVPRGTPVLAVDTGIVTKVSIKPEGGQISGSSVTIRGLKNSYFYTHLSAVSVHMGEAVTPGKVIGRSGVANGVPHLHFGVMSGDPRKYTGS